MQRAGRCSLVRDAFLPASPIDDVRARLTRCATLSCEPLWPKRPLLRFVLLVQAHLCSERARAAREGDAHAGDARVRVAPAQRSRGVHTRDRAVTVRSN